MVISPILIEIQYFHQAKVEMKVIFFLMFIIYSLIFFAFVPNFAQCEWILSVRGCTHHDHGLVVVVVSEHGEGGGAEHGEPLLVPGVHPLPAVRLRAVHDHQQVEPPNLNTRCDTVNVGGGSGR